MSTSAIGWINAMKTATLLASSQEPLWPVSNLVGDQGAPSAAWQTLSGALTGVLLTVTPLARTTFRSIGAFRTNLSSTGTMIVQAYTNPGLVLVATAPTVNFANGQAVAVFAADTAADVLHITFANAGNPDNHLNIPLVFAGPMWFPTANHAWSSTMGRDDLNDTVVTRGGQTFLNLRATSRRWNIVFDSIRSNEAYTQIDVLDRYSRIGSNVLFIPDTTSADMQSEATFGIWKASADISFPLTTATRRSWAATLSERL